MSFGGPSSGITFSGLSSGIDVNSIVTQLVNLQRIPVQRLERQKTQLGQKQQLYSGMRSAVVSFNSALSSLQQASSFNPIRSTTSNKDAVTVSASANSGIGAYSVSVQQLAQSQKLSTSAQANATDALGYAGVFRLNSKELTIEATDTLTTVAQKINGASAGVTASLINGGPGQTFLTMTAQNSGTDSAVRLENVSGTALSSLGLTTGVNRAHNAVDSDTMQSIAHKSQTSLLSEFTGRTGAESLTIDGKTINFDYSSDTLETLKDKINAQFTGGDASRVQASVVAVKSGSTNVYRLQLDGSEVPTGLDSSDADWVALGMYEATPARELVAARDAKFKVDTLDLVSSSNTVTDVVPGATMNLLQTTTTDVALNFTRDLDAVKTSIRGLRDSYNGVIDYIRQNSQFDPETFQAGPLFGDSVASQIESSLAGVILGSVGGGTVNNLTQIGFDINEEGKLSFNESTFDKLAATDMEGIKDFFVNKGTSDATGLSYVTSSNKTLTSTGSYSVNITQAASKTTVTALTAFTSPSLGETITFSGTLIGSTSVPIAFNPGQTAAEMVTSINGNSRLKDLLSASINGDGKLVIESKKYGPAGNFSVVSSLTEGVDNSGFGTTGGVKVDGLDLAGTINGEAATGSGQFLIGNTGNAQTEGLQIQYTGSTLGSVGNITYTRGMAGNVGAALTTFTDSVNGLLTSADAAIVGQTTDIDTQIGRLNDLLVLREQSLRQKFAKMEEAIARSQSQGSTLSGALRSTQSS